MSAGSGKPPPRVFGGFTMGKYFIGWLLGVPAGLLVLIYVFTHVF